MLDRPSIIMVSQKINATWLGEWCSHHAREKSYKGPFRVRQFSGLATNYRLVLLDHQGIRQSGLIFRG